MTSWQSLDRFAKAYIEAALWSSNDESDESGGSPLDSNYDQFDIAPEALEVIAADCLKFQTENEALLSQYYDELPNKAWTPEEQAGHDFWLSRNGHGAGFFDRDAPEAIKDALQDKARQAGEVYLYVGDDGLIYHSPGTSESVQTDWTVYKTSDLDGTITRHNSQEEAQKRELPRLKKLTHTEYTTVSTPSTVQPNRP